MRQQYIERILVHSFNSQWQITIFGKPWARTIIFYTNNIEESILHLDLTVFVEQQRPAQFFVHVFQLLEIRFFSFFCWPIVIISIIMIAQNGIYTQWCFNLAEHFYKRF